jgi:hypothetical protein
MSQGIQVKHCVSSGRMKRRPPAGGIWSRFEVTRALLAHTTRAALWPGRRVGDNTRIELDEIILEAHRHYDGWTIPIQTRAGAPLGQIEVSLKVPDLLCSLEAVVTTSSPYADVTRIGEAVADALRGQDLAEMVRGLIHHLAHEAEAERQRDNAAPPCRISARPKVGGAAWQPAGQMPLFCGDRA